MVVFSQLGFVGHFAKNNARIQMNSVSASPCGKRFATAGGDGIKIWSLPALAEKRTSETSDRMEDSESNEALLCTLNSESSVQCLRWSPDGKFLASGDDLNLIKIWVDRTQSNLSQASGAFDLTGSSSSTNVERWKCIATYRGHTMDVTGLSWSPDGGFLASSSIDNSVRVWAVDPSLESKELATIQSETEAVLKGHDGWVKDVAWDPVGRYLASVSDDRSVTIWRCADWRMEARVQEPFIKSSCTTMRRQLDWSPDGVYLCVSHAFDEPKHVAFVIERNNWQDHATAVRLVGHSAPVCVTAFSPAMYQAPSSGGKKGENATIVAIADDKATLTIWSPGRNRPIVVCKNMFKQTVLDMSWTADGRSLLVCSMDGNFSVLDCSDFDSHVGTPLDKPSVQKIIHEYYGKSGQHATEPSIPESTTQLNMERALKEANHQQAALPNLAVKRLSADPPSSANGATHTTQSETRTVGGKRRISPVSLTQVSQLEQPVNKVPKMGNADNASSNGGGNSIIASIDAPSPLRSRMGPSAPASASVSSTSSFAPSTISSGAYARSTLVNAAAGGGREVVAEVKGTTHFTLGPNIVVSPTLEESAPTALLKAAYIPRHVQLALSRNDGDSTWVRLDASRPNKRRPRDFETAVQFVHNGNVKWTAQVQGRAVALAGNRSFVAIATRKGELFLFGSVAGQLLLPAIQLRAQVACLAAGGEKSPFLCCVMNDAKLKIWDLERLVCIANSVTIDPLLFSWQLAEKDGEHDSSGKKNAAKKQNGRRPITLESGIRLSSFFQPSESTSKPTTSEPGMSGEGATIKEHSSSEESGEDSEPESDSDKDLETNGRSGDMKKKKDVVRPESTCLSITPNGTPLLVMVRRMHKLSSKLKAVPGDFGEECAAFAYSSEMAVWVRITDATRFARSDFFSTLHLDPNALANKRTDAQENTNIADMGVGVMAALQQVVLAAGEQAGLESALPSNMATNLFQFGADVASRPSLQTQQRLLSLSHLESLLASAAILRNPDEYKAWLKVYVDRLVKETQVDRLRALCESLIGPQDQSKDVTALISLIQSELGTGSQALSSGGQGKGRWHPKVMGTVCKNSLLRDLVLPALSQNRQLQGLVVEYTKLLGKSR